MTYWQTYRAWLIAILNERIYLSTHGHCPELLQTAVSLQKLIEYNGYRSDTKLASFILRKQREIRIIIPSNGAYEKQISKLNQAIQAAQKLQDRDSIG